jgi:hypothetical protein
MFISLVHVLSLHVQKKEHRVIQIGLNYFLNIDQMTHSHLIYSFEASPRNSSMTAVDDK